MVRFAIASAVALVAFASTNAPAHAQGFISFHDAYLIAQKAVPAGTLFKARLEQKATIYGFYFEREGRVIEIEINRNGGKIVKNKDSESDGTGPNGVAADVIALIEKNAKAKKKLPIGRLMEIAADALKDSPFTEFAFAKDGDKLVVKVGDDYVIDAETGKVTKAPKK